MNMIEHLKLMSTCVVRGYQQAIDDLGREGDYQQKDWSEPYKFLKERLAKMRQGD